MCTSKPSIPDPAPPPPPAPEPPEVEEGAPKAKSKKKDKKALTIPKNTAMGSLGSLKIGG